MSFFEDLENMQKKNNSLVCVGLDIDLDKVPDFILKEADPVFSFNKEIVDQTKDLVCCYKPNIAFYEALGIGGLNSLKNTLDYIHTLNIPVIIDAKRNDIGNTAKAYAKGLFEAFDFDAITVNPYMGSDSVEPFASYKDKGIFILAKTSNKGSGDFENLAFEGKPLYEQVVIKSLEWNENGNIGFVVGATYPEELRNIREIAPESTYLIPGIGAQGGDVEKTIKNGIRKDGLGVIINSSRGIIYASKGQDFAEKAREEAIKLRDEINKYR